MSRASQSLYLSLSSDRGSVTLPAALRRRHHLDEPGAQVEVVERADGVIELRPVLPHDAEQAWFWTDQWQGLEREAQADIDAGRVTTFDSPDAFLADLASEARERQVA